MARHQPEMTAEALLQRIREEVGQQEGSPEPACTPAMSSEDALPGIRLHLPRLNPPDSPARPDKVRHLKDLLCHHDRRFLSHAYGAILHRRPDDAGTKHYLEGLRTGRYTRTEIIGRLRFSPEGRARKVTIRGLLPRLPLTLAGKLPVLGYAVRWVVTLVQLPDLTNQIRGISSQISRQEQALNRHLNQWAARVEAAAADTVSRQALSRAWTDMTTKTEHLAETIAVADAASRQALADITARLDRVDRDMDRLDKDMAGADVETVRYLKRMVLDQQRRLGILLEEVGTRMPEPLSPSQMKNMALEQDHLMDAMYASFEDRFRGTRSDIKARQQQYLPLIRQAGAGTETAPVLDLGCGRGEWLELLGENNQTAVGVDINRIFTHQCREAGLTVVEHDLLAYLQDRETDSIGAVTAFQLIEHLPLKTLVQVMDETLRVLKPGGMVIFETPNPENLMVGACHFYTDPTHHNPIPPATARHLLEARGFADCEILRRHPYDDTLRAQDITDAGLPTLVRLLYGDQDYAVIGYKAGL